MVMSRVLFWAGFGVLTRMWQLGIQMQPLFSKQSLIPYPIFAAVGGSFGWWLQSIDETQRTILAERKAILLEKRARRAQREAEKVSAEA